jgi:tRNA uridine 5-carboxymethylaminomethyl modification enzyme
MSEYKPITEEYDAAVIGAGHAGCEAALACARLGLKTVVFTVSVESIALMPCNPNIGGSSKGHLVREIDALGGEMGKNIDRTFIQSKMLNISKGPAVHSLRAQADKAAYTMSMRHTLENQKNLTIVQQETSEILAEIVSESPKTEKTPQNGGKMAPENAEKTSCGSSSEILSGHENHHYRITGIRTVSGAVYHAKAVILCTGVYLKARCIYGEVSQYTGPNGLMAANHLSQSMIDLGIRLVRFKTGTPARIDGRTIDYDKMTIQPGDREVVPFSFSTDPKDVQIEQVPCWLTYTNEKTHEIIRENIDRSPLYSGAIHATGPRYCPSIEDKVVKFAEKDRHQVFIEPEGRYTNEMYIDGMSSSMPEDVQHAMYHSVPGLENAKIVRNAYAIEYDCLASGQLRNTLEFRDFTGLFSAGQFNGSSGYEEAAAQGLIAGINASMEILNRPQLVLDRSEAYIGVLIDDLVTKENLEPYRMMTSRAEYRLLLRQDNADLRLRKYGYEVGLIDREQYDALLRKEKAISREIQRVNETVVGSNAEVNHFLEENESTPLTSGIRLSELIRRPELDYAKIASLDPGRPELPMDVQEQVNIEIKYDGYIRRQKKQVEQFKKLEKKQIPADIDYELVRSLRIEARQKLMRFRPSSIGQASRIAGVTPADVTMLLVYLEQNRKECYVN